ncbi:MAG: hypothetical protein V7609_1526 [Verrucomicrobiota bacterium]
MKPWDKWVLILQLLQWGTMLGIIILNYMSKRS